MDFLTLPFFERIASAKNILIAGAGGGFDVFTGLPLYFGLKAAGKEVHLANLSFSTIYASSGRRFAPAVVEIKADTMSGGEYYFPELYLAQWFASRGESVPIYAFDRTGVVPIAAGYKALTEFLKLDAVILVDGGTDSLMRGDEPELGTPEEDSASIAAVHQLEGVEKFLICLGFGVDTFHGVCHAYFLEAVADLIREGGFLGAWSLTREMPEVALYAEAAEFVRLKMVNHPSIVSSSILSAIEGQFGDYHETQRTEGSELFINALMSLYWCFDLDAVARRSLYLEYILETETYRSLQIAIALYRMPRENIKPWMSLPM
jgi:hypothetical protein